MYDFEDIDIPDLEIDEIIEEGIVEKQGFFKHMKILYKNLGGKVIFIDRKEISILSIILTVIMFLLGYTLSKENNLSNLYGAIFILSPVMYLIISLYGVIKAKENNMLEIEKTLKYNLYQIATFRIFVFSILTGIINIFVIGIMSILEKDVQFIRLSIISVASIFIFSSILLLILLKIRKKIIRYGCIVSWSLLNLWIGIFNEKIKEFIFIKLPIGIHIIIGIIALVVFINALEKLTNIKRDRGEI
ncbi:hypothetical protein [uncultured Clostridium sp.]|uniref:hypothetical protein n=1 Tax=uncultured Clostridium sp. TaxID=59620 RepID=UPI00262FB74F|nr:hypothetical protein [uncultured Clostridium sp.]